jgi:hypothetical protein
MNQAENGLLYLYGIARNALLPDNLFSSSPHGSASRFPSAVGHHSWKVLIIPSHLSGTNKISLSCSAKWPPKSFAGLSPSPICKILPGSALVFAGTRWSLSKSCLLVLFCRPGSGRFSLRCGAWPDFWRSTERSSKVFSIA